MPNTPHADNASKFELDELVARIGVIYPKKGLSPPFALRDAAWGWQGLSKDEIVAIIEQHFQDCRRFYTTGAGEQCFHMVRAAIAKALDAKYPHRSHVNDEPDRSRRRPSGRVRRIHTAAGGRPDAFVEGRAARLVRRSESNAERPSGLVGYEKVGEPIGEDDDSG